MKKPALKVFLLVVTIRPFACTARADDKAVRLELVRAYAGISRAMAAKDVPASLSFMAPGYAEKSLNGAVIRRPQIDRERKAAFASARTVKASFQITGLSTSGNNAVAATRFTLTMVTLPSIDPARKTHRIIAAAPFKHTWVRTRQGWKMKRSEELKGGRLTIDGKSQQIKR